LNRYVKLIEGSLFLDDDKLLGYLNETQDINNDLKERLKKILQ
jgi:hypothetical protein